MKSPNHAVVVLSGGQDSVTCLGYCLALYSKVSAISFNYGQRHAVELKCAALLCEKYKVPHLVIDVSGTLNELVPSALTGAGDVGARHVLNPSLPASFVPNRNALLLVLAHAHAQTLRAHVLVAGMCQTDFSGYPDCRRVFITQLERALSLGSDTGIHIETPLMNLTKAQTFELAHQYGFLEEVLENSHTCYNGDHEHRHPWGYGCGECPACKIRATGWESFQADIKEGE